MGEAARGGPSCGPRAWLSLPADFSRPCPAGRSPARAACGGPSCPAPDALPRPPSSSRPGIPHAAGRSPNWGGPRLTRTPTRSPGNGDAARRDPPHPPPAWLSRPPDLFSAQVSHQKERRSPGKEEAARRGPAPLTPASLPHPPCYSRRGFPHAGGGSPSSGGPWFPHTLTPSLVRKAARRGPPRSAPASPTGVSPPCAPVATQLIACRTRKFRLRRPEFGLRRPQRRPQTGQRGPSRARLCSFHRDRGGPRAPARPRAGEITPAQTVRHPAQHAQPLEHSALRILGRIALPHYTFPPLPRILPRGSGIPGTRTGPGAHKLLCPRLLRPEARRAPRRLSTPPLRLGTRAGLASCSTHAEQRRPTASGATRGRDSGWGSIS